MTSQSKGYDNTDLALLTDRLRSKREQGITIDAAYLYFASSNRNIIADTPWPRAVHRNVVNRSANMPWYGGSSLMHLENVHIALDRDLVHIRLPVQHVSRPDSD